MNPPISARIDPELRQELARYCSEHGVTQTEAIAAGLKLLLAKPQAASAPSPVRAMNELALLSAALAGTLAGFDAEAAEDEGRD